MTATHAMCALPIKLYSLTASNWIRIGYGYATSFECYVSLLFYFFSFRGLLKAIKRDSGALTA